MFVRKIYYVMHEAPLVRSFLTVGLASYSTEYELERNDTELMEFLRTEHCTFCILILVVLSVDSKASYLKTDTAILPNKDVNC